LLKCECGSQPADATADNRDPDHSAEIATKRHKNTIHRLKVKTSSTPGSSMSLPVTSTSAGHQHRMDQVAAGRYGSVRLRSGALVSNRKARELPASRAQPRLPTKSVFGRGK